MRRSLALLMGGALALGACSAGPERRGPPLDPEGCGISSLSLPMHEVVLDSAGLSARMLTTLSGLDAPDTVSLLVRHSADSVRVAVRRAHGFAPEVGQRLESAVINELLPPENEHGNPPYRLLLNTADGTLSLGSVRMCPPRLLNVDESRAALERAQIRLRQDALAIARITVDTTGLVSDVSLLRSSGDANVDALALGVAAISRWTPARWDGEPVRLQFGYPVRFVVRGGTRRR